MLHACYILLLVAASVVFVVKVRRLKASSLQQEKKDSKKIKALSEERDALLMERSDLEASLKQATFDHLRLSKEHQDRSALLQGLQRKINRYIDDSGATKSQLRKLLSMIDEEANQEKDALIIHLEQVNTSYVDRLKAAYPNLTVYDYRLCTFIKTGMSTREIAHLLNVLPSSINVSRSRLRKKLQLNPKQDLYAVLNAID